MIELVWYTGVKWLDIALIIFYAAMGIAALSSMGEKTSSGLEDKTGPDF